MKKLLKWLIYKERTKVWREQKVSISDELETSYTISTSQFHSKFLF